MKALECCIGEDGDRICWECPCKNAETVKGWCDTKMLKSALDLFNRLQAENERLRYNLEAVLAERADHSGAIKEFVERLLLEFPSGSFSYSHIRYKANNLVKEMVGEGK